MAQKESSVKGFAFLQSTLPRVYTVGPYPDSSESSALVCRRTVWLQSRFPFCFAITVLPSPSAFW